MEFNDKVAERIARRVYEQLAGAGLGEDPEESLLAVTDRLVARDGREATARSLRELADEIAAGSDDEADDS